MVRAAMRVAANVVLPAPRGPWRKTVVWREGRERRKGARLEGRWEGRVRERGGRVVRDLVRVKRDSIRRRRGRRGRGFGREGGSMQRGGGEGERLVEVVLGGRWEE